MKGIYKCFLLLLFLGAKIEVGAYDFEVDGFYYETNLENMTATLVSGGTKYSGNISIPDIVSYNGRPFRVVAINGAFKSCSELTGVSIPNSIVSIEDAFSSCSSLNSITIPKSVIFLGANSFRNCSSLKYIEGAESVVEIGTSCFSGCNSLTSIIFPDCLLTISSNAFNGCNSLVEINVSDKVAIMGESVFANCKALQKAVLPQTINSIPAGLFENCQSLVDVKIPSSVTEINERAFNGCTSLPSLVIPSSVNTIENFVFNSCTSLNSIIFEDGDTTLKLGYNSYGTTIGDMEQNKMKGLFKDCPLQSLYLGRNLNYDTSSKVGYSPFCGIRTLNDLRIGETVTKVPQSCFQECWGIKELNIPKSVKSIGEYAFFKTGIKTLIFQDGPNSLSFDMLVEDKNKEKTPHTFQGCSNLLKVYIGRNLTIGSVFNTTYWWYDDFSESPSTFSL